MSSSLESWLEDLAAKQPTPGGGAAAGMLVATAAALAGMVANYTTGTKWQDREEKMTEIVGQAAEMRRRALGLMQADEAAFAAVGAAYKLAKESDEQKAVRQAAIHAAITLAADPPVRVVRLATEVIGLLEQLLAAGNPNVVSDVAVAASSARAAIESAVVNIEINAVLITDQKERKRLGVVVKDVAAPLARADALVAAVRRSITA